MVSDGGNITSGPEELASTLRQVEELRRQTRAAVHPAWFPLVLFGAFGLASTPFCAFGEGLGVGLFWLVAGPVGGVLTSRYYRNRALATGAGMRGGPYWAVAAGIFVACFLAGSSGSSRVQSAGPMVAVALGYLAFARLERSWTIATVSGLLAAFALAVGIADIGHSCVLLSLTFGVVFTGTGLVLRRGEHA
ncbi:MAG: hypothetical protein M3450_02075 [Actinomycetota bacterium]|nr:hypothetical protein [Actinomycetota bacterium]